MFGHHRCLVEVRGSVEKLVMMVLESVLIGTQMLGLNLIKRGDILQEALDMSDQVGVPLQVKVVGMWNMDLLVTM